MLYDSPVILEYLDSRAGGAKIIPKEANARFAALTLQALCDGILDAGILLVYEGRWRPAEKHEPKWLEHQRGKVQRALDALEAAPPKLGPIPNVGQITLACALGYGDLRFEGKWREGHPRLVQWHEFPTRCRRSRRRASAVPDCAAMSAKNPRGYARFFI